MRWMFDTNTCIYLINQSEGHERILRRMSGRSYGELLLSAIALSELRYGVKKSRFRVRNTEALGSFLEIFDVLDYPADAAEIYGSLRATLERRGTLIGGNDMLIAAHAMTTNAALVTRNTGEFGRIPGLRVQNWLES